MLWYNNPEAVQTMHQSVTERREQERTGRLLRLVADHAAASDHSN
ncbi:MAG: hypothetical protein ACR2NL_03590 [Acidimicrobiia bacterium]